MSYRRLLVEFEVALLDYSAALTKARNPSLTDSQRLELIQACDPLWERVQSARREIDRLNLDNG